MSELVRSSASGNGDGNPPRTRVLIVRQGVKSIRPADAPNPLAMRLSISLVAGLGGLLAAWLIGLIGGTLGAATHFHLPGMEISPQAAMLMTARIIMEVPGTILRTGMEYPLLLMLGYVLIALPGGCLAGARSATPGGPKPHVLSTVFAYTVAILCALQTCVLLWWVVSPFRTSLMAPLPFESDAVMTWMYAMQAAAGLDLLALLVAVLWVVLILRVAIPLWLRALCAPAAIFVLIVVIAAMSMTNATVALAKAPHTMIADGSDDPPRLMFGRINGQAAMMTMDGEELSITLESPVEARQVVGRQSLVEFVTHR